MTTSAVVMLVVGIAGLWGTLAAAIVNYLRKARQEPADGDQPPQR